MAPTVRWESFLRSLAAPQGPLSPVRATQVLELWQSLERSWGEIPPPHAAATEAGGFSMTWDRGRHHFEIEVLTDGTYDWFYMDRDSQDRAGAEAVPLNSCGPEMSAYLRKTLEETWRSQRKGSSSALRH
ncbi:MAG TPA: hypothetical protein VKM72_09065 [Thermoanaerobaculia bacterium]|nr:hypothetical protein [Thermoanaerobaculia bacterium]